MEGKPPPRIAYIISALYWKVKPDSASHQRIITRNARKRKYRWICSVVLCSYVTSLSGEITVRKTSLKLAPVTICRSFKKEQHLVACIVSASNRVRITSSKRCFWQQRTRYRYAEVHVLPSYLPISPLFRSKEIYVFLLICLCLMSVLFRCRADSDLWFPSCDIRYDNYCWCL